MEYEIKTQSNKKKIERKEMKRKEKRGKKTSTLLVINIYTFSRIQFPCK